MKYLRRSVVMKLLQPGISRWGLAGLLGAVLCVGTGKAGTSTTITSITDHAGADYTVGVSDTLNTLTISNSGDSIGRLTNVNILTIGSGSAAWSNSVTVFGSGAGLQATTVYVGGYGSSNTLMLDGGAWAESTTLQLGRLSGSGSNALVIAGSGTIWTNRGGISVGPSSGMGNSLTIRDGGRLVGTNASGIAYIGNNALGGGNSVIVTGSGSVWTNATTIHIGYNGANNSLTISDSGVVYATTAALGGQGVSGSNNTVLVMGTGSLWRLTGANGLTVGSVGAGNLVTVSNGGRIWAGGSNLQIGGGNSGASNNAVMIAGDGSVWTNFGGLYIGGGTAGTGSGGNSLSIRDGGFVHQTGVAILGNGNASASNSATISGVSSLWVNASTWVSNSGRLALLDGGRLQTGALTLDSGSSVLFSNGTYSLSAAFTNQGTTRAINSRVTFVSPVVLGGAYVSDPSTNTFTSNLTVTASGALSGSNGDLFVFNQNLLLASTNRAQFALAQAAVLFTNAATHLLSVSNSGALNLGQGFTSFAQVATNFAIGQLSIASGNRLTIAGNQDSLTNALYVGWLDLQGAATNSYAAVTNALRLALNLPNINVYYDSFDSRNDWLNANLLNDSASGYDLWGGGFLLPIPEPSALALAVAGTLVLVWRTRRR
ncbi:MAG: hypothetical protein IT578_00615 [Verrucomicrobiae bacterium]|nr:hypothetical protein [Verrucomicrobiae bacterium]